VVGVDIAIPTAGSDDEDCDRDDRDEGVAPEQNLPRRSFMGRMYDKEKGVSGDAEAAEFLYLKLKDRLATCKGVLYAKTGTVWMVETSRDTKKIIDRWLMNECHFANFVRDVGTTKQGVPIRVPVSTNTTKAHHIIEALRCKIPEDPTLQVRLLTNTREKLVFSNGYYDFKARVFVKGLDGIDTLCAVDQPFPILTPEIEAAVRELDEEVVGPIFKNGSDMKPFFHWLARALAGHYVDKLSAFLVGPRGGGKTLLTDFILQAFDGYVGTIVPESLLVRKGSSDAGRDSSYLFDFERHRLIVPNEIKFTEDSVVNGVDLKKIQSGGEVQKARGLYVDQRQFRMQASLLLSCNVIPSMCPVDAYENIAIFKAEKVFTNDKTLLSPWDPYKIPRIDKYRYYPNHELYQNAFLWMVLRCYREETMTISDYPQLAQRSANAIASEEGDEFDRYFVVTGDEKDTFLMTEASPYIKKLKKNAQAFVDMVTEKIRRMKQSTILPFNSPGGLTARNHVSCVASSGLPVYTQVEQRARSSVWIGVIGTSAVGFGSVNKEGHGLTQIPPTSTKAGPDLFVIHHKCLVRTNGTLAIVDTLL
jgi:hypothetical protein